MVTRFKHCTDFTLANCLLGAVSLIKIQILISISTQDVPSDLIQDHFFHISLIGVKMLLFWC